MSEWAEFCEALGYDPGCPDDYDQLLDDLASGTPRRRLSRDGDEEYEPGDAKELRRAELRLETYGEAQAWSARNRGRAFVRSIHGPHYVPKDGVDAPLTRGAFVQRGVTVWPPKRYPADNPAAACWVPGTYPTSDAEDALAMVDSENDRRTFEPRLRKLAPVIYNASCRLARGGIPDYESLRTHLPRGRYELFQVLALAENRIERHEQYCLSQDAALRRPLHEREEPDDLAYVFAEPYDPSRPSVDLAFWRTVYDIVMEQLIDLE